MVDDELTGWTKSNKVLYDLGFFARYLHMNVGGRSGKQNILAKLDKSGGVLSQRELQGRSCISSAALSEVLSKLENEGLIERTRSKEDRRQMMVVLTEDGVQRAAAMRQRFEEFEKICLICLNDDEQSQLVDLLDRLRTYWESLDWKENCA